MIKSNAPDSLIAKANLAFEAACRIVIQRARQSGIYDPEQYPVACTAPHVSSNQRSGLASRDRVQPWVSMMVSGESSRMVFDQSVFHSTDLRVSNSV
jgi:hypothetical protein